VTARDRRAVRVQAIWTRRRWFAGLRKEQAQRVAELFLAEAILIASDSPPTL
jgi:hypothetical protein